MGALLGARGGVAVPERDRRAVYEHLADHYREFDKEPPDFKTIQEFQDERYGDLKDDKELGEPMEEREQETNVEPTLPLKEPDREDPEVWNELVKEAAENINVEIVLEAVRTPWTRDPWADLLVGLSALGDSLGHELTPKETAAVSFIKQLLLSKEVKEKTALPESAEAKRGDIAIEDMDEFRKSILEAVHNEFVLPVTGKLF